MRGNVSKMPQIITNPYNNIHGNLFPKLHLDKPFGIHFGRLLGKGSLAGAIAVHHWTFARHRAAGAHASEINHVLTYGHSE